MRMAMARRRIIKRGMRLIIISVGIIILIIIKVGDNNNMSWNCIE
jgi:hypothetical protein